MKEEKLRLGRGTVPAEEKQSIATKFYLNQQDTEALDNIAQERGLRNRNEMMKSIAKELIDKKSISQ